MTGANPLDATQLAFGYDETQDRLLLIASGAGGQQLPLHLTRRLTARLVNGFAKLLEQSSPAVRNTPADVRDDVIMLEHQSALYGGDAKQSTLSPGPGSPKPATPKPAAKEAPRLVTAVSVSTKPNEFQLVMRQGQTPLVSFRLNRLELHRILEVISRRAKAVGWNITIDASWLEPGQTEVVFN